MIDYHIHSVFSFDGKSPLHDYVNAAGQGHVREIGFAEHVDVDPRLQEYLFLDATRYYRTVAALTRTAPIPIRCGIEVSYQHHLEEKIKAYASQNRWDFIIGSVHEVEGVIMDRSFLEQHDPVLYFDAVKSLVKSDICDIVGHLEYFRRWGGHYTSRDFKSQICEVLELMIKNDLVLEVNTSGLRHPAHSTYPSLEVLQWYKTLGGEYISLGSDAHHANHLGFQFSTVIHHLKTIGFDAVAAFENRHRTQATL